MLHEFLRHGPLAHVTAATGGVLEPSSNDLLANLMRINKDMRTFYTLGYYRYGPVSGGFHSIRVHMKNKRLQVRARAGYYDEGGGDDHGED